METNEEFKTIIKDSEYIKLSKMSRGYNWEIKVFIAEKPESGDQELWDKLHVARLKVIDAKMQEDWGSDDKKNDVGV